MADSLGDFGRKVSGLTDPASLRRVVTAGAQAGKTAALKAAAADLGGDRAFSGLRRKAPLGAGYDTRGTEAVINFRPAGLWRLADQGRRRSGVIAPRKRGGRRAVLTPDGPRARSSYRSSRGLGTYNDAVHDAQRTVPKAAHAQFVQEIGKVF